MYRFPAPPGILIVDMQREFLNDVAADEVHALLSRQQELLGIAARNDYPVVALEYRGYGPIVKGIKDSLARVPRRWTCEKNHDSGFSNERLRSRLRGWGLDTVCITGVSGPYCVQDTANDAVCVGFTVVTSVDLIATQTFRQYRVPKSREWFRRRCTVLPYDVLRDALATGPQR